MRTDKILASGLAVGAQVFALVVLVMANSACSCLPPAYREVELSAVPPRVLERARGLAPGLAFERAWKQAYRTTDFEEASLEGYVLRARAHWYETRDIRVPLESLESGPVDLRPVE